MKKALPAACRRLAAAGALACALAPGVARAAAPEPSGHDGGGGQGGAGTAQSAAPPLSDEDREVIENLDLLQSMDGAKDLDLLLELSRADGD
ncbi:MAG TPA: hypothetical protein VFB81_15060 [Myxococcales bacterium]|nr:hypothetical protein [Myxococcales bacterium]